MINKQDFLELLEEYKRLEFEKLIDYEKIHLYSIITHSTGIEGPRQTIIDFLMKACLPKVKVSLSRI